MTSTSEYSKIFDSGIDFALNSINEQCDTDFKSLHEALLAIQAMKGIAQPKNQALEDTAKTAQAEELEFAIKTHEGKHNVRISPNDDGVWMSLFMSGCNAYTTMTKDEARQLINALTTIVEAA